LGIISGNAGDAKREGLMNILLLSRYGSLGASSRLRSFQYLPYLRALGHTIDVAPFSSNLYVQRLYEQKRISLVDVVRSYVRRIRDLFRSGSYDLVWIEYESLPWIPVSVELALMRSRVPFVLDYDDAIFHRYDLHSSAFVRHLLGQKIDELMKRAALVIAGNEYIAQRARAVGARRVEILPTAVDLSRFDKERLTQNKVFTVGWIGTPQTSRYLQEIEEALKTVCHDGAARFVAVGSSTLDLEGVPLEVRPWNEQGEVEELTQFDVGVMPLLDSPWERGKCGHKLLLYMAASCPVVASPVGVNTEIVEHGTNGYLASQPEEWIQALNSLRENSQLRTRMGQAGRRKVARLYATSVIAPRLASLLSQTWKDDR
jgi:glycosyltransferase involved in cell wall biosynthesis